jgi:V/A-type H+-transporting ATPase subunit I
MKKIILITQSKDIDSTLESVRNLGLLHVEHENSPVGENISALKEKLSRVSKTVTFLPDIKNQLASDNKEDSLVEETAALLDEKETLIEDLQILERDIEVWEEWGNFNPGIIEDLKNKDIYIRLCKANAQEMKNVPEGVALEKIFQKGNIFYCAAVSTKEIELPFETLALPEMGMEEMLFKAGQYEKRLNEIEKRFLEVAAYKNVLRNYENHLSSLIEFNEAVKGSGRFEKLSYIKGYLPADRTGVIEAAASEEKWGILISDPEETDIPPTLIKNPKWVEVIKPMFDIIKTIPGYKEVDISLHFLIFFSIFFGMLIGDAGYGLIYFSAALIAQKKFKALENKSIFFLTYILSSCAIIWGLMTGVFFGPHPWMKPMAPYFSDNANVQAFCFLIGAVQMSIAHIWKILRKFPSLKVLSDVGWICILWSVYFLAKTLIIGFVFPDFMKWVFIAGSSLVILFTSPAKNVFAGIGAGLGDYLLKVVNSFADTVSYIRLFAVGLAGVAIANAFNQISAGIGYGSILSGSLSVFVLFAGHTLNLAMGILSILVHGVRLNVLEFSGHLDMEWSGVEYAPFKCKK